MQKYIRKFNFNTHQVCVGWAVLAGDQCLKNHQELYFYWANI